MSHTPMFLLWVATAIGAVVALHQAVLLLMARGGPPPVDLRGPAVPEEAVSVIIPCFNEELVLRRTVDSIFRSRHVTISEVICVDDGSTDGTLQVMLDCHRRYGDAVRVVRQPNGGKAAALNNGLAAVSTSRFVSIDADTQVLPDTVSHLVGALTAGAAAVSGQMLIGNRRPASRAVLAAQVREYDTANNIERRALSRINLVGVVPGAIGGFDCATVRRLGGYPAGTLAEDAALTMTLLIHGHRVVHEPRALVLTEAPDTVRGLLKQRIRWATGKLQVLRQTYRESGRRGAAVRGVWWHLALTESFLPLLTPLLMVATPVCFLHTLSAVLRPGSDGGATAALVASVVVTGVGAAVTIASTRTARALAELVRPSLWLPAAGNPLTSALILTGIRFTAVLLAGRTLLAGGDAGWNKLERSGDVLAVGHAGAEYATSGGRRAH